MDLVMIRELKLDAERQIQQVIADFMDETGLDVQDMEYDAMYNPVGEVVSYHVRLIVEV